MPLADRVKGHIQGVVVHQSSAASDIRRHVLPPLPTSPTAAEIYAIRRPASAGWRRTRRSISPSGSNWPFLSAEIVIENAFDKRAQLSRYAECGVLGDQRPYIVANVPRTIGLRLGHSF